MGSSFVNPQHVPMASGAPARGAQAYGQQQQYAQPMPQPGYGQRQANPFPNMQSNQPQMNWAHQIVQGLNAGGGMGGGGVGKNSGGGGGGGGRPAPLRLPVPVVPAAPVVEPVAAQAWEPGVYYGESHGGGA
jgi:hypothetical protein